MWREENSFAIVWSFGVEFWVGSCGANVSPSPFHIFTPFTLPVLRVVFFYASTLILQIRHLGARGVMLRIPPPEDDGFALALVKMERVRSVGILGGETAKQDLPSVRVARRKKR